MKKLIAILLIIIFASQSTYAEPSTSRTYRGGIIITFDDNVNMQSIIDHAFPIMQNYGFRGVTFYPTSRAENDKLNDTWKENITTFINAGWEIGSHSHTHPHFNKINNETLFREVEYPKEVYEREFPGINNGLGIITLAYPFGEGRWNDTVDSLVRSNFQFVRPAAGSYNWWMKYPPENGGCWGKSTGFGGVPNYNDTSLKGAQEAIDFVNQYNQLCWITIHGVSDDPQSEYGIEKGTFVKVQNFRDALELINQSGIPVITPMDLYMRPESDFYFAPEVATMNVRIDFFESANDEDGDITFWFWEFGDGENTSIKNASHKYSDKGIYNVTLTVTDNDGNQDTSSKMITINNLPPTADFSMSVNTIKIGESIQFVDKSSDPEEKALTYEWDFGDRSTSTQQNPQHQYSAAGLYDVKLTITDDEGVTDVKSVSIQISGRNEDEGGIPTFLIVSIVLGILVALALVMRRYMIRSH